MDHFSYRKLDAYISSKDFVIFVYKLIVLFPREENYALCDQLRRAVISIPSNIAEGMGRSSLKEQVHFLEIAFGSLNEVMCQLELANELNFISQANLEEAEIHYQSIAKKLSGLRNKRLALISQKSPRPSPFPP